MRELRFDVLVLGAGGAGCAAAITAARGGASVALVTKETVGSGNTRMSGAEITSSGVLEGDSPQVLMEDMIRGGELLNDPELVKTLAEGATPAIEFLEGLGQFYQRDPEGRLSGRVAKRFGGHTYHRSFFAPGSGMALARALRNSMANTAGVEIFEDCLLLSLLREEGEVRGGLVLDLKSGGGVAIEAGATLLATGGSGWLYYPQTTNNRSATGDGYAAAFDAGAELVDMEMVQFFPFAINHPPRLAGSILDEPILAGPKGRLINGQGDVVADRDINRMTRAQVTAMMAREITAGRATRWGGLRLDLSGNLDVEEMLAYKKANDERGTFDKVREAYGEAAFQWKEPWDVSPSAHYMLGGVRIDPLGRTTLGRLFAAGEAAGGVMGANRLGTTSIADIFVRGIAAGGEAVRTVRAGELRPLCRGLAEEEWEKTEALFGKKGRTRPITIMRRLQRIMGEHAGIARHEEGLARALQEIDVLQQELERHAAVSPIRRYNTEVLDAVETKNMLVSARLIATCARMRRESRGAHLRLDYPVKNDRAWLKNLVARKDGDGLEIRELPRATPVSFHIDH